MKDALDSNNEAYFKRLFDDRLLRDEYTEF
jgi:hypothetical protein